MKTVTFFIYFIVSSFTFLVAETIPKNLLIYYGCPSLINVATYQAATVSAFSDYYFVVWRNGVDLYSKVGGERHKAGSFLSVIRVN